MNEYPCAMCGKPMTCDKYGNKTRTCSKTCYGNFVRMIADNNPKVKKEPDLAPLTEITDDAFVRLVSAVVEQARNDVLTYSPGTLYRKDAEEFFVSEYFEKLTGQDGFEILCRLQDEYDEKHRKKEARRR